MFVIPQNESELEQIYTLCKSILKARNGNSEPVNGKEPWEEDPIPGEWSLMESSKLREETKAEMAQVLKEKGKSSVIALLTEFKCKVFSDIKDDDLPLFRKKLSQI